jgi:hypothetical protein
MHWPDQTVAQLLEYAWKEQRFRLVSEEEVAHWVLQVIEEPLQAIFR